MPAKKPLKIGDRVRHKTDQNRQEGVVVHVNKHRSSNPIDIHWYVPDYTGPAIRGCYNESIIEKIPPKSIIKLVEGDS